MYLLRACYMILKGNLDRNGRRSSLSIQTGRHGPTMKAAAGTASKSMRRPTKGCCAFQKLCSAV